MRRVSSAEFVRKFSAFSDEALAEPIVLTRNGRDRLLVVSVERYKKLLSLAILNVEEDEFVDDSISELEDLLGRSTLGGE